MPPFTCFNLDVVQDCAIHEKSYSLKISTFTCKKCKSGFFLIENFCIPRTTLEFCLTYSDTEDKCKVCESKYYVDEKGLCRESFSSSVKNSSCEVFFDQDQCLKCAPNHFLDEEKHCEMVPVDSNVQNCLYYRGPSRCLQCIPDYFLVNGSCVSSPARNCKE